MQTSVAAHVLAADPDRLDREALVKALDGITETCREARSEVRTTLDVLRATPEGPLPDLASLPDLVRTSGADLTVRTGAAKVPAAVGAAAYRIVQESLTNAVRHGSPGADLRVDVGLDEDVLTVRVTNGRTAPGGTGGSGYGILGMRERARSVGGTLSAGPRDGGGFEVAAQLPLPGRVVTVIRVLLADDQTLVRASFALLVDSAPDMRVVGQAANGREAVELARSARACPASRCRTRAAGRPRRCRRPDGAVRRPPGIGRAGAKEYLSSRSEN